jgi:hypothetical protein
MKRRESIKYIFLGTMAGSLAIEGCVTESEKMIKEKIWRFQYGRTAEEAARDEKLLSEIFFKEGEKTTITRLANLILPPNQEGNIEQADVPDFIEFIVKDLPSLQKPIREGLIWLNDYCRINFNNDFIKCTEQEQTLVLDKIAYPNLNISKQKKEVEFFRVLRNLVMTGYFTSEIGVKELGYKGNQPNVWNGVPDKILKEHGMSYDSWADKFIDPSKRNEIAVWDDQGNLIS